MDASDNKPEAAATLLVEGTAAEPTETPEISNEIDLDTETPPSQVEPTVDVSGESGGGATTGESSGGDISGEWSGGDTIGETGGGDTIGQSGGGATTGGQPDGDNKEVPMDVDVSQFPNPLANALPPAEQSPPGNGQSNNAAPHGDTRVSPDIDLTFVLLGSQSTVDPILLQYLQYPMHNKLPPSIYIAFKDILSTYPMTYEQLAYMMNRIYERYYNEDIIALNTRTEMPINNQPFLAARDPTTNEIFGERKYISFDPERTKQDFYLNITNPIYARLFGVASSFSIKTKVDAAKFYQDNDLRARILNEYDYMSPDLFEQYTQICLTLGYKIPITRISVQHSDETFEDEFAEL